LTLLLKWLVLLVNCVIRNALSSFSFVLLIASSNANDGPDARAEFEKAGINTHFIPFIWKEVILD
jgi:hypothetical protein